MSDLLALSSFDQLLQDHLCMILTSSILGGTLCSIVLMTKGHVSDWWKRRRKPVDEVKK